MRAAVEKHEKSRGSLHREIEVPRVEKALQQVHRHLAQRVTIPGFRRGRVPRVILERRLGLEYLVQEAVDLLFPEVFREAVEETGIEPIGVVSVDLAEEYAANMPLKLTVEVDVKPEVELPEEYKGVAVERAVPQITDADVDDALERRRQLSAQMVSCDEDVAVAQGHYVTIDYYGLVDGNPFPGGADKDIVVVVGEDHIFEDLNSDALIGALAGETREFKVTLSDRFNELAGKEAVLYVDVIEIKERQLPALDDEFAKDVSSFDTLDELRADIRRELEERAQNWADLNMRTTLIDSICKQAKLEIPELLIQQETRRMINDGALNLLSYGVDPREVLTPENVESLVERYRPDAEETVRRRLVLEAIAEKEGITVTSEEVDERIQTWVEAEDSTDRAEEIRKYYEDPERREALAADLLLDKVIQFLVDNAVITETVMTSEESDADSATEATDQSDDTDGETHTEG